MSDNFSIEENLDLQTVLFDLDGTLVDTAPDLAIALNQLRIEKDLPPLPYEPIRKHISNGALSMLQGLFGMTAKDPSLPELSKKLMQYYGQTLNSNSRVFPGYKKLLWQLAENKKGWGVVTNKPRIYAEPLLKEFGIEPTVLVCPDDVGAGKPNPAPLLVAAEKLGVPPAQCLYVGDNFEDMEAARKAGMQSLAVTYGYHAETEDPYTWGADHVSETPKSSAFWIAYRLRLV